MADALTGAATTTPGRASLILTFDLDQLAVGAGVTGLSSPLQKLLAELPAGTQTALAWVPDLDLTQAQTLLNLQSGDFGAYVAVSDANGNQLASTFLFLTTASGETQAAIGLALDIPVDLAATPLFGSLLSGVKVTDLEVTYASQDFTVGSIVLPPGCPPPSRDVPSGFGLVFTVDAEGSAQSFVLPPATSDNTSSIPATAPRRLLVPGPGQGGARPLASQTDSAPPVSWFPVQKSLGPLFIDRVGVVADNGTLGLALDAALNTDVVSIQLTGFTVTFAPSSVASAPPGVSLDGLEAAVDSGPLQIGGSLARSMGPSGIEYDGSLLIRIGSYAINAAGSYAVIGGAPSLFVFGIAQGEFGGPPAFFVTGLAAGFGLNRALRLPAADQVATFPLIEAAAQGPGFVPPGVQGAQDSLAQLNSGGWVPPTLGEYWVAAGVAFRSFEIINGFVLVIVEFGQELVIALLGIAALQLPTEVDGGPVFGYIEITLEAVLRPAEGTLSIEALLTPNSYVIDPACRLTGGIAFDMWFGSNPHAGDFVFTAGGYNPVFPVPSWYPAVPRLGFSWNLSDALQIIGESYFALTPSCVMGGGLLSVTFAADGLRAWFTAQADFIMYWRPFFFDIDVNVSIGVSYTGSIAFVSATFTVELGVAVELWGPPLRGVGHVNWWVISFDVAINGGGSPSPAASTLADWPTFAASSLPAKAGSICRSRPAGGLQAIIDTAAGDSVWLFSGDNLALATETLIPASQAVIAGPVATTLTGLPVHVYPLGNATVSTKHEVCVAAWSGTDWQPGQPMPAGIDVSGWDWTTITGNRPAALWGQRGNQTQPPLAAALVPAVVGVTGASQATLVGGLTVQSGVLSLDELPQQGLPLATAPAGGPGPATAADTRSQVASTINDPSVTAVRDAVAAVANASNLGSGLIAGTLPLLAAEVYAVLTDPPMVGPPGSTGAPAAPSVAGSQTSAGTGLATVADDSPPSPAALGPLVRALFRQDRPAAPAWPQPVQSGTRRASRPSSVVLDRWSTVGDMRLLALPAQEPGPGDLHAISGQVQMLWPAMTAVWDLPAAGDLTLRWDAAMPLWIVALDAAQRVSQIQVTSLAETAQEVQPGMTRLAVTGLWDSEGVDAVGWHGDGMLRQIASQTLLGDGVVLRPQSPGGLPRRRSSRSRRVYRELGVTTGRQLVDRNWTLGEEGRIHRGWVETYLPTWCRAVVVSVVSEIGQAGQAGAPSVRVRLRHQGNGQQLAAPVASAATGFHRTQDRGTWLFPVPGDPSGADQLVVRAAAAAGWRLDGVFGFATPPAASVSWPPVAVTEPPLGGTHGPARVWWE
jgi:hypothetical protein